MENVQIESHNVPEKGLDGQILKEGKRRKHGRHQSPSCVRTRLIGRLDHHPSAKTGKRSDDAPSVARFAKNCVATNHAAGAAAGGKAAASRSLLLVLLHPGGSAVALRVLCFSCDLLGARNHKMPAPVLGMVRRQTSSRWLTLPVPFDKLSFFQKIMVLPGRERTLMKLASPWCGAS